MSAPRILFLFLIVFCLIISQPLFVYATEPYPQLSNSEDMNKEMKEMKKQMEKVKREQMEMLEKDDPKMYQKILQQEQASEKISQISSDYFAKKISYETAKSKLYPLVKENMKDQFNNVDDEIEMLEQRLTDLKKAKINPGYLINQQIDNMLGKSQFFSSDSDLKQKG